jgi:hypothetical protein
MPMWGREQMGFGRQLVNTHPAQGPLHQLPSSYSHGHTTLQGAAVANDVKQHPLPSPLQSKGLRLTHGLQHANRTHDAGSCHTKLWMHVLDALHKHHSSCCGGRELPSPVLARTLITDAEPYVTFSVA